MPEQQRGGDRAHAAGDGVSATPSIAATAGSTSPARPPSGVALVPTSMTVVPGRRDRADHAGPADGGDQDVGLAGDRGEVRGPRMADGHGRVPVEQQVGDRLPTTTERPTTTACLPRSSTW